MSKSNEDPRITEYMREVLKRGSRQGRKFGPATLWPTITQYARWIGCSPQLLHRFAHGQVRSLGQAKLDTLAYLTGAFPQASPAERLDRLRQAEAWLRLRGKSGTGLSFLEYLHQQDTESSGRDGR